jgi:hypothetical protein
MHVCATQPTHDKMLCWIDCTACANSGASSTKLTQQQPVHMADRATTLVLGKQLSPVDLVCAWSWHHKQHAMPAPFCPNKTHITTSPLPVDTQVASPSPPHLLARLPPASSHLPWSPSLPG